MAEQVTAVATEAAKKAIETQLQQWGFQKPKADESRKQESRAWNHFVGNGVQIAMSCLGSSEDRQQIARIEYLEGQLKTLISGNISIVTAAIANEIQETRANHPNPSQEDYPVTTREAATSAGFDSVYAFETALTRMLQRTGLAAAIDVIKKSTPEKSSSGRSR